MNGFDDDYLPATQGGEIAPYAPTHAPVDYSGLPTLPERTSPWSPDAGYEAPVVVFGQRVPGVTAEAVARDINLLHENFSQSMQGVPQYLVQAAQQWFQRAVTGPVPKALPAHGYDLAGLAFKREDHPYVTAFCNALWRERAPASVVRQMLGWYTTLVERIEQQQRAAATPAAQPVSDAELDRIPDEEIKRQQNACMDELRSRWGRELPAKMAVVRAHMNRLPQNLRDHLELNLLPGNVLSGNSPDVIEFVYRDACGLSAAPSARDLAQQIDEIEHVMRTDRKRYNRDTLMQARYRELLQLRDG